MFVAVGALVLLGLGRSPPEGCDVFVGATVGVDVGKGEGVYVCVGVSDGVADGWGRDGGKLPCVRIG
jgi:hypothetical protein